MIISFILMTWICDPGVILLGGLKRWTADCCSSIFNHCSILITNAMKRCGNNVQLHCPSLLVFFCTSLMNSFLFRLSILSVILHQYNANIVYLSDASHCSFCIMALRYIVSFVLRIDLSGSKVTWRRTILTIFNPVLNLKYVKKTIRCEPFTFCRHFCLS